tara:strand:+ start:254 stop:700 length:447 start_codon:yes stop_codon:yes gene_type:complete
MTFEPLNLLAQMDGDEAAVAAAAAGVGVISLIQLVIGLAVVVANWKIYSKAGKPGWAAIIPIYNLVVWLEIVGRPTWWIAAIILCPPVALVMLIILLVDLGKSFGKDGAFAAGLVLLSPIFLLILGFGSAEYQGPAALAGGGAAPSEG